MDYSHLWDCLTASSDDETMPSSATSAERAVASGSCQLAESTVARNAATESAVHELAPAAQKEEAQTPRVSRWLESLAAAKRLTNPLPAVVVIPDDDEQATSSKKAAAKEAAPQENCSKSDSSDPKPFAEETSAVAEIPCEPVYVHRGVSWKHMVNRVKFPSEEGVLDECNRIVAR